MTEPPPNILLAGPRGCGKTTVARALAAIRGGVAVDLDDATLARFPQATITAVWTECGEPAWREAEVIALRETLDETGRIIALGGGTPTIPEARAAIEAARAAGRACVVYLACSVHVLAERLAANLGDRPSLSGADPVREVASVLARREPVYREVADVIVSADGQSPDRIAESIARAMEGLAGR